MIEISHVRDDFSIDLIQSPIWDIAKDVLVDRYWSCEPAPAGRHFKIRILWSGTYLYARFDANQAEPLVVSESPNLHEKTLGLWDRDVCEIFIAPDKTQPRKYFEFEIAPSGEWVDLAIDFTGQRITDFEYESAMESSALIETGKVVTAIRIPWTAFGVVPKAGDVWFGNLFRCIGKDPNRGYLAWQPTMTEQPNFHLPACFGEFVFK